MAVEGIHAFEIEGDGELAFALGNENILDPARQDEAIGVLFQPGDEGADVLDGLLPGRHIVADIDRKIIDPGRPPVLEDLEIDRGIGLEAGVIVPDEGVAMKPGGALGDVPVLDHIRHCRSSHGFCLSSR